MRSSAPRWLPLAAIVFCLLPPGLRAAPPGDDVATPGRPIDARAWLARIHLAANRSNFQGVMVFSTGGTMTASRVWHYAVGDQTFERLEVLDGRQQHIVRQDDLVQTLWPQTHLAVIEHRQTLAGWSTTPLQVEPSATEQYDVHAEGMDRVAGRPAAVFRLEPRDQLRYAQRLWADHDTGLLLRDDVIGLASAHGGPAPVLESTAFSEIEVGVRPDPGSVKQEMLDPARPSGYRILQPQQRRTTLAAEGWTIVSPVPGFRLAGCILHNMDSPDDGTHVLQAVFSDGLTHVSIFVEPFRPQRHRGESQGQRGATSTLILRRGDYWVTAVGDVPMDTLRRFSAALDRQHP